jgi:hypothetical protein
MLDFKVTKKRTKILKRYSFIYERGANVYKRTMLFDDAEIMKNNGNSYNYYYWVGTGKKDNKVIEEITWAELVKLLAKEYPND